MSLIHKLILVLLLNLCLSYVEELHVLLISFCRYLWISKETLIKHLSVIVLRSIECILDRRLLLLNKIYLVCSLWSSHRRGAVNLSLLQCAGCFYRRVRCWDTEVRVYLSMMSEILTSLVILLIRWLWTFNFRVRVSCGAWLDVFTWILLLRLLSWIWVILIPSILTLCSKLNRSLWRWRRRISSWCPSSSWY